MNPQRIAAIVLIVLGASGLAYKEFSYTKETHDAKIGSIELSFDEKETIKIPIWLSGGALALGLVLLVAGPRKR